VGVRGEEDRKARGERIQVETARDRAADILDGIRERKCQLLNRRGAGLANVIARDRDRVPIRCFFRAETEYLGDEGEARLGRIDVRAARYVLFQDVVL